jgi:hypothetical protein
MVDPLPQVEYTSTPVNAPPTQSSPQERFLQLGKLPTIFKPLPTFMIRPFGGACERLAAAYLAEPDQTLLDILAPPQAALLPAITSNTTASARTILERYPISPWPTPLGPTTRSTQ